MRRFSIFVVASIIALPSVATAQSKRPMALDDLLGAIRVGDPQLSPDGRRVLFVRTVTDIATGRRNSDIWTVPADGSSPPQPFIESPKSDDTPRFLSDGRVAFISTREGAPQVYIADAGGRNARAVTNVSGGVQSPLAVSANGGLVAYVSDVYPACSDDACNTRTRDSAEKDPVKAHSLTRCRIVTGAIGGRTSVITCS
jgi:acylaminoacyl-peptidase